MWMHICLHFGFPTTIFSKDIWAIDHWPFGDIWHSIRWHFYCRGKQNSYTESSIPCRRRVRWSDAASRWVDYPCREPARPGCGPNNLSSGWEFGLVWVSSGVSGRRPWRMQRFSIHVAVWVCVFYIMPACTVKCAVLLGPWWVFWLQARCTGDHVMETYRSMIFFSPPQTFNASAGYSDPRR